MQNILTVKSTGLIYLREQGRTLNEFSLVLPWEIQFFIHTILLPQAMDARDLS